MVTGRTITIKYEAGDFYVGQGYEAGSRAHYNSNGYRVNPIGFGNATVCKTSKLILSVDVGGLIHDVLVDRFFKDNLGRLTVKRRWAIMNTMPVSVILEENLTRYGNHYYTVAESDMNLWLNQASRIL